MSVNKLWTICTLTLLSLTRVHADIEYSNLGPNDSFDGSVVAVTGPASGFGSQTVANQFTAGFTGLMTVVEVAIEHLDGPAGIIVSIELNDPTTNLPLVNSRVTLGTIDASGPQLVALTLPVPYSLTAGTAYWLELAPQEAATVNGWHPANNRSANLAATSLDSGATFQRFGLAEAFRVNAVPVKIVSIKHQNNNHIVLQCLGMPNAINRIEASPDLSPGSFSTLASIDVDATGTFQYEDINPSNLTTRFYRIAYP